MDPIQRSVLPALVDAGSATRRWVELAALPADLPPADLWRALVDRTECPERYGRRARRTQVLDHDASVVVRRTWAPEGDVFDEYVHHHRCHRVENRRADAAWATAQALVERGGRRWLVYEVLAEGHVAAHRAGIDRAHALRVLALLLDAAATRKPSEPPPLV